ncbi:MAG: hypothetical protein NT154_14845 [Verrucomicrobia bacterium]|nr:hypothetical protein [Verrucomicrobiota bacterium]
MNTPIIESFRSEFNWMQREVKGLYPWVDKRYWQLLERIGCCFYDHPFHHFHREDGRSLIGHLLSSQVQENPLLDVFQKALVRAEIRFISRFILQRSNEERLTGNLVSELDAAVFLARAVFRQISRERYRVEKEIDFYYYDLSRGGKVEKQTGADLGFILVVDLPDHPFTVRSVVFQAKKCDSRATIDIPQLRALQKRSGDAAAYLFYDMSFRSLASPIVIPAQSLSAKADELEKKGTRTFSLQLDEILNSGIPLSLYLLFDVIGRGSGTAYTSFEDAFSAFRDMGPDSNMPEGFNGRVGIVSIGKPIVLTPEPEGGLHVSI